jgi:hypothetical protein
MIDQGPRTLHSRFALAELLSCAGLFAAGLAINLTLAACASAQGWLTGEEASVAFKDVVFLHLRLQHCRFDTNLGGQVIFALAYALHPDPGLFYGRETKAVLLALAGPLVFLVARRLDLSRAASLLSASCLLMFPGFSAFSWVAIEIGLEQFFGGLALYLALGRSIGTWPLAGLLLGFGVLVYGGALAFVPPVLALLAWRIWNEPDRRHVAAAAAALGLFGVVLTAPSFWWLNTSHLYRGGGTLELAGAPILFLRMLYECFYKARSYYFFSASPALGGVLLLPFLVAGLCASSRKPRIWWPLWLLAAASVALYCISAQPTGMRRSIALVFVASLLLGLLYDTVASGRRWPKAKAPALAAWVILVLGFQTALTAQAYLDGSIALPHDFDWIDSNMRLLLDRPPLDTRTKRAVMALEQPIRAMCLFHMLPPRQPETATALFDRAEIRDFYLTHESEQNR